MTLVIFVLKLGMYYYIGPLVVESFYLMAIYFAWFNKGTEKSENLSKLSWMVKQVRMASVWRGLYVKDIVYV